MTENTRRNWIEEGKDRGATHVIVASDDFSHEYYPVYVTPGQDVESVANNYRDPMKMSSVKEIIEIRPKPKEKTPVFYVIKGCCGPDNYTSDNGPILEVEEFATAEEVEADYKEFMEDLGKEDSQVTYRVIEGKELKLEPVQVVTAHKLKR